MKHELKRKPDVQKTTMFAIVVNAVQIGVLFAFVLYVLTAGPEARNSWSLQFMVIAGALMAAWGAGVGEGVGTSVGTAVGASVGASVAIIAR